MPQVTINSPQKPVTVLSWNVMGKTWHIIEGTFLSRLCRKNMYKKVTDFLNQTDPDIICLQEARQYLPQKIDETLRNAGYNLVHQLDNEHNFNIIASKFPIINSGEVFLEGADSVNSGRITRHPSSCVWVDCNIQKSLVRIYNCQFRIRGTGIYERILFLKSVLKHAESVDYPTVICGDMNTTIPTQGFSRKIVQLLHAEPESSMYVNGENYINDERFIFDAIAKKSGFREILDLTKSTWALPYTSWELFKLKLDWFFVKNIECKKYFLGRYITDHRPVFVELLVIYEV